MFDIPKEKREYWNSESVKFLNEIKKEEIIRSEDKTTPVDDNIVVLQPISMKSLFEYDIDCDGKIVGVSCIKENKKYRIDNELWLKVEKCINDFCKIRSFKTKISKDSFRNIVLSWLFEARQKEQISIDFIQYIENELDKRIKDYVVYFPIPYLEVKETYKFAQNIFIGKFPNRNLRTLLTSYREDIYHQNSTFVYTKMKGERQAVVDMAYERCSLAVDIIKACYLTFYSELPKICLDIANDINHLPVERCFIHELSTDDSLHVNENIKSHIVKLDENFIQKLEEHSKDEFVVFIDRIFKQKNTELEKVLIPAIRTYSKMLLNSNNYDKIVDLCSIMDSLILLDEKESIKQALKKYIPLIITDTLEMRQAINKNIEKMYDIRSKYIHHRNTKENITRKELFNYSVIVFSLITKLVIFANSNKYKTMKDIITVIDKKIKNTIEIISFEQEFS